MVERQRHYVIILKKHKGERVLFLDSDVIILKRFLKDLNSKLDYYSIVHQGVGIIAVNSNEETIRCWENLVDSLEKTPEHLRKSGFPETEFQNHVEDWAKTTNNYKWFSWLPKEYGYLCKDAYIYHAMNGGTNILEKKCAIEVAQKTIESLNSENPNPLFHIKNNKDYQACNNSIVASHGFFLLPKGGEVSGNIFSKKIIFNCDYAKEKGVQKEMDTFSNDLQILESKDKMAEFKDFILKKYFNGLLFNYEELNDKFKKENAWELFYGWSNNWDPEEDKQLTLKSAEEKSSNYYCSFKFIFSAVFL